MKVLGEILGSALSADKNNSDYHSKKDDKYQKTIQSSTTPDPGYHMTNMISMDRNNGR